MSVIDAALRFSHKGEVFSHDEILAEMKRQLASKEVLAKDIAAMLGIHRPRITEMVKGERRIQPEEMDVLASFLGMTSIPASDGSAEIINLWGRIPADRREQALTVLKTFVS